MINRLINLGLALVTKRNLNPAKTPSTALSYAGFLTLAGVQTIPGSEEYILVQAIGALVSLYLFYRGADGS